MGFGYGQEVVAAVELVLVAVRAAAAVAASARHPAVGPAKHQPVKMAVHVGVVLAAGNIAHNPEAD